MRFLERKEAMRCLASVLNIHDYIYIKQKLHDYITIVNHYFSKISYVEEK